MAETAPTIDRRDRIVLRFAGDSGDGMQLAGTRFTAASALFGNDLATLPNFPAEIRAPQGTLPGVSSFQVQIADTDILTPGDAPDVLVAMNPAALKSNLPDLRKGGLLLVNSDAFEDRNLTKAGYETNPLENGDLEGYHVLSAPMEELTKLAVADTGVTGRGVLRSKNFFALGLVSWMFNRSTETVEEWVTDKFAKNPEVAAANVAALKAGYNFGVTTEEFHFTIEVDKAALTPGTYTNITGNQAVAWGLLAGSRAAELPLFYGSYPITPASSVLEELAKHKNFGVRTFQAEDEIAAVGVALGASFAGHLGVTGTSGPGVALKSETISLALITELPLVILNVQRAGPSTGLPTKTEQADLLMSLYGRHGEAPLPVLACATPSDAFETAMEACRLATKYMTPVILLSDGYVANSSEPWRLPDVADLPTFPVAQTTAHNAVDDDGEAIFYPYQRDADTLARPWAVPGTPGLEHRLGGLEKSNLTGNVEYDPTNHENMTIMREQKIAGIAKDVPRQQVHGPDDADILVLAWGSTFGAVREAVNRSNRAGLKVAHAHLRYIHPLPANLGEILDSYDTVLVPELNRGQLSTLIRSTYLKDVIAHPKIQGLPFMASEIEAKIKEISE
ncbi:MAG: 2-oxoacid:acceptor oxidoreductase subunit alpha [Acidimicrobiia bacterium]|nr:2-oxoacid:acceptor oxidoreductase subunit alpha [Acidimicrobiia bacterium]MBT8214694.1 2-oxoacid:acceptor oxidoreductase subunit alpha [Acidimicrobiia bacterium]NNF69167.1 2-oxoacid:acceptor oxidoreductase subunit alpha [Acidimicrobiia bacterium]NNK91524.1 2-oxoacid:acceptor oxidoreductase subunit alpha [Acidimicrobiia bacterium]